MGGWMRSSHDIPEVQVGIFVTVSILYASHPTVAHRRLT
jgi:hypothetical protein